MPNTPISHSHNQRRFAQKWRFHLLIVLGSLVSVLFIIAAKAIPSTAVVNTIAPGSTPNNFGNSDRNTDRSFHIYRSYHYNYNAYNTNPGPRCEAIRKTCCDPLSVRPQVAPTHNCTRFRYTKAICQTPSAASGYMGLAQVTAFYPPQIVLPRRKALLNQA